MNSQTEKPLTFNQSIEAERGIIASILVNSKVMDEIAASLSDDDFITDSYRLIWSAAKKLYDANEPIDVITISNRLQQEKVLMDIGGLTFLTSLANSEFTSSYAPHYAKLIKRESVKRKGMTLSEDIRRLTLEDDFETIEEYMQLLDSLYAYMRPDTSGKMKSFSETEEDYFEFLSSATENIQTGFRNFDEWSGGIGRGWLYILAGRPSIGKTAKAMQMASNISKQNVGDVLVWSQEMTFNQLKNRILSTESGVNFSRIRKKTLDPFEVERLKEAHAKFNSNAFYVEDSAGVTIDHIVATARQIKRKKGQIGAILVDYLTRMNIKQNKGETWSRAVGEVAKRFKWLAQEIQCPIIILAQLNREGAEGAPQLQHLRDSGEIEQEADIIEFLWQDPDDQSRDGVVVQSTIAKGRDTGIQSFRYLFKGWIQKYEDYNG